MDFAHSTRWLQARGRSRVEPGLARIAALLEGLGRPDIRMRGIHVVGTNGKGSTSEMAVAALAADGQLVGSMPSPHLHDYTERIRVGGRPITRARFARLLCDVRDVVEKLNVDGIEPTQFEILTAAALLHFSLVGADCAVVEAGLGGRDDATNVLDLGVKVITNVGIDHQDFLGETDLQIAANKAGVIRDGDDVILGTFAPAVDGVVHRFADAAADVRVAQLGAEITIESSGPAIRVRTPQTEHAALVPQLSGAHQRSNLALAVAAVDAYASRVGVSAPTDDSWQVALNGLLWPGRLEIIDNVNVGRWRGRLIIDGAHNPHAVTAAIEAITTLVERDPVVIFGAMRDKPVAEMLDLIPLEWPLVLSSFDAGDRALSVDELSAYVIDGRVHSVSTDPDAALGRAAERAGDGRCIVVLGSLALVAAVRAAVGRCRV